MLFRVFSWFWGVYESTQWRSWVKFWHLLQNTPCVLHVVSLPLSSRLNVSVESEGVSTDWTVMSVCEFPFNVLFPLSHSVFSSSSLLPSRLLCETRHGNTTSRRGKRTRASCLSLPIWWDFFNVKREKKVYKKAKHKESKWNISSVQMPKWGAVFSTKTS